MTESFLLLSQHRQHPPLLFFSRGMMRTNRMRAPQPEEPDEESTFKELKRQCDEILGLFFPAQWSTKKKRKFMKTFDEQLEA